MSLYLFTNTVQSGNDRQEQLDPKQAACWVLRVYVAIAAPAAPGTAGTGTPTSGHYFI